MTASLPRRSAAVTALALTASSGIALVAATPASAHVRNGHTSLSIREQHARIAPGGSDVISGQLRVHNHTNVGRSVSLQDRAVGATAWATEATHSTGKHGGVQFTVSPTATTRYRLSYVAVGHTKASKSGVVVVRVVTNPTKLAETVTTADINPGDSDTVNGTLTGSGTPIAGGSVILKSRTNSQKDYHQAAAGTTGTDGTVSFTVTPTVTTHYRLVFRKTATNPGAVSNTSTVHVDQPSALSIGANENRKKTQVVITGRLHAGSLGLGGRTLALQSSTAASPTFTTIATQKTNGHGAVTFKRAAPSASTTYQLVWAGGPNYAGSTSAGVTIS
jgi:hypothetical protein